ncbi:MAG: hypothetical protein K0S65_5228 [Labilithrix sp.]|nr:hypothetical protein [Labilithrix sp.]
MRAIHVSLSQRTTLALVTLGLTLGAAAVACAGNEDEGAPPEVDAGISTIPVADATPADAPDATDGGCSDDSADCGVQEPSCKAEWCPVTTIPDERIGLSAVWGSGPSDVWVVGAAGSVLHWDGSAWATASAGTTQSLYAVWGSGPNDVWAVSTPGAIFHTTGFANGTAEWSRAMDIADAGVDTASAGKLSRAIWGTSPRDVWVGGDPFARKGSTATWGGFRTLVADDGVDSGVADGGIVWTPVWSSLIMAIWGSGPEDIWVVGPGSKGLASGGSSAAHSNGSLGADGVPVWTAFDTQSTDVLYAIWGSGPGDVWTVGDHGTIRHFTAGATRWSIIESPTTAKLRGAWGSGPSDVWAVGEEGTLIHYDGTKWSSATADFAPGEKPSLFGVWGSSSNDVWAVGSGTIFHYSGPKPVAQGADR